MPQLQTQVPHPLAHETPCLLPPGGVAALAIRVEFLILIGEHRLEGATMQIKFDDIGSGECLLWPVIVVLRFWAGGGLGGSYVVRRGGAPFQMLWQLVPRRKRG